MAKKTGLLLIVVLLLVFAASCGPSVDKKLVGSWQEVDSYTVLVFSPDGKMGVGVGDSPEDASMVYNYKASKGKGEYWHPEHRDINARFEYTISKDTLEFRVVGGFKGTFTRVK